MIIFNRFFRIFRFVDQNRSKENAEKSFGDMLPYSYHYDDETILTKDNRLISVIKIDGFSHETADDADLDNKKDLRNNLFKGLAASGLSITVHTIRRRYSAFPRGEFDNIYTKSLNDAWKEKFDPRFTFKNEHYLTIIKNGPSKSGAFLKNLLAKLRGISDRETLESKLMKEAHSEMKEIRDRVYNGFSAYKARVLGVRKTSDGNFSEICEFFGMIANLGYQQNVLIPRGGISNFLNTQRLYFGLKIIEAFGPTWHKFGAIVSLKEYRPATFAGTVDNFLSMSCEFIMTQTFTFTDRGRAVSKMQLQQRRLMQAEDIAVSQVMEINEALDAAMSGTFAFGLHSLSILCIADNIKSLDNYISQAIVHFSNSGIMACRESLNMELCFWGQFPGNSSFIVRKSTINTLNLAGFASFHNFPSGKYEGNHWGSAVTVMNTTSGTPYFFNFHARDVGHTLIIGPTGGGKTVLLNFLSAQAQKFKPRLFFFDKDHGAELFIRAIGGEYSVLDPGARCGFNPLQLPDTPQNRNFLQEWIKILVSSNGEKVTAQDLQIIADAIDGTYRLPKNKRKLSNLASFMGLEIGDSMATRLKMWYGEGTKAGIFDNEIDVVDFTTGKTFSFEMAEALKDPIALAPMLLYIFHRITESLDGTPTMVVLDEAWALIGNEIFAPKIKDWLKVMRKLNAFMVFATQSVEDAAKSSISDTLVQQTATQIFLPNLKATEVYKDVFMLSQREYALVKTTDPATRFFLLKQDTDGVIARINMSGMDNLVNILSGRTDLVRMVNDIRAEYGDDPNKWLPIFYERLQHRNAA